jgi:hypothetical protein
MTPSARLGLILVVALTLAGCGTASPTPTDPTATPVSSTPAPAAGIAWVDQPASLPAPPAVPGARAQAQACSASQLSATAHFEGRDGGTGHLDYRFSVANTGSTRCSLIGAPQVESQGAGGHMTVVPTLTGPVLGYAGIVGYATIDPGESAWLIIETSLSCNGGIDPPSYRDLVINVAGGAVSVPDTVLTSTCTVLVSTWYRPAEAQYTAPNRFANVSIAIGTPDSVRRGTDLMFTVTLTNNLAPITLTPCPVYTETLAGQEHTFELNCTAPTLPTGDTRFLMRVPVPANLPAGATDLMWQFDEPGVRYSAGNDTTVTLT